MSQVAKAVIIDNTGKYLLMKRSDHPWLPYDYDLAGGTIDGNEQPHEATARELLEEIGLEVDAGDLELLYEGDTFSKSGTYYYLYEYRATIRPRITISWEHSEYSWVDHAEFVEKAAQAKDTYMHMVSHVLSPQRSDVK